MAVDQPLRFGIIGATSMVARLALMPAMARSERAEIVATASLSGGQRYEEVLEDDRVGAVYIPLPNSLHREWVERAALAGKHVLCEKPLACSAPDAEAMAAACADNGVVLMEAYMTLFHPRSRMFGELVGRLGGFLFGSAAFTGRLTRKDDHRWSPKMGGGALLDVGIYVLAPLLEAAGVKPGDTFGGPVAASAHRGGEGVDASFSGFLCFESASACFQCSFEAPERQVLEIVGRDGSLVVERAFTPSLEDKEIVFRRPDGSTEVVVSEGADPYQLMLEHFCDVVAGRSEPLRPPQHSIALARLVDRLESAAQSEEP